MLHGMSTNSPTEGTGDAPADVTTGGGKGRGSGEVPPFSPEQLVLIDCLIGSHVPTTRDPPGAAGASGITTTTTGEYSLA